MAWIAAGSAVTAAACQRSTTAAPGLFCRQARLADPGAGGLNPLLAGQVITDCFDDRKGCEVFHVDSMRGSLADCQPSGEPSWHCYSTTHRGPTSDPLNHVTTCLPARALCDAARPDPRLAQFGALDDLIIGACAPVETVSCFRSGTGAVTCFADETTCRRVRELDDVIGSAEPRSSGCAPRRSVAPGPR